MCTKNQQINLLCSLSAFPFLLFSIFILENLLSWIGNLFCINILASLYFYICKNSARLCEIIKRNSIAVRSTISHIEFLFGLSDFQGISHKIYSIRNLAKRNPPRVSFVSFQLPQENFFVLNDFFLWSMSIRLILVIDF